MKKIRELLAYYPLAMAEGEGAGTAYEYYVKARALKKIFKQISAPKKLLIAGIPERYGFSMDFVLLARALACEQILVLDERRERLEKFKDIYKQLSEANEINCRFETEPQLYPEKEAHNFDLFISCEVLQRLSPEDQKRYWRNCFKLAKAGVVFTPNAENPAHATHSNLRTLSLDQLKEQARAGGGKIIAGGYIDMPPFPPGITRSDDQRESAGQGIQRLAFKIIEQWAKAENLIPLSLRRKNAHIVYVAAVRT